MSAKISQALHQVMSSVGYIQKTGKNAFHGYKYAGEADLLEKLRPAMLEAGLLLIPSITSVSPIDDHGVTTVQLEYSLVHKDGDVWPFKIGAAGQGGDKNKNGVGDKGLYKAITGANKYLLFKLFQIETGDDPENEAPPSNGKRENPHVTRPEDIGEPTEYDAHGQPIDNIPLGDRDVTKLSKSLARGDFAAAQTELRACKTITHLQLWGSNNSNRVASYPSDWQEMMRGIYADHMADLRKGATNGVRAEG